MGKKRIELLKNYAANYENMNNETADAWMKDVLALGKKTDKLLVQYFKKIKKKTSPKVTTQFYQFESYVLSSIRSSILEAIPFVGEMDG